MSDRRGRPRGWPGMSAVQQVFGSSVGRKYVMAGTGAALFLFVVGHLVGNLQIFLPPAAINRYAHFLQSNLEVLWPVRVGLLTLVGLHVWAAVSLTLENRRARPVGYAGGGAPYGAELASRTMLVSGLIVASFLVYHLLHYTVKVEAVNGAALAIGQLKDPATGHADVYAMMVAGFSVVPVSLFYLVGVGLLCFHLSHGLQAMFQSLGWRNAVYGPRVAKAAKVVAVVLFVGYASIPVAVLCGHGRAYLNEVVKAAPVQPAARKGVH